MRDLKKAGKYEILSRIGEGGFGVVYKGRDPFIKRTVAIKTCTSENEGTRRRFLREAEIAGNIVHPNITVVYDFGFQDEVPYLVQEFLSGEDLDIKIARKDPIPLRTKLDYLLQAAQGLGFAHEQGITHRDIKPSNLRILADGRVKIMDFGIAKLASGETQLTQTGTTLGTPAYLSPEQLRGDEVDARSDIYSFGALAYELLTYRRMFDAQTISALFFQILHQEPTSLTQSVDGCPGALDELVARCVAKDADQRYQSFVDIIVSLRKVLEELPVESGLGASAQPPAQPPATLDDEESRESDRQAAIAETRNEIEELLASGSHQQAAEALATARERFGDLVPFRTLHERLVQARAASEVAGVEESAELLAAVEGVRRLTHEGRLAEAQSALESARREFPEGPSLIAAGRQLRVQSKISEARAALTAGRVEDAEKAAQRAQELDPDAPQLPLLLRSIEESSAALEARKAESEESSWAEMPPPSHVRQDTVVVRTGEQALDPTAPSETPTAEIPIFREGAGADTDAASDATVAPWSKAASQSRPGLRMTAIAVAAVVVLVLAILGLRRIAGSGPVATGRVALDASPWAELVSLTDAEGAELAPTLHDGDPLFTPLSLELPAGRYRATLARPDGGPSETFDLVIEAAGVASRRIELEPADADSYFRAAGLVETEEAPEP